MSVSVRTIVPKSVEPEVISCPNAESLATRAAGQWSSRASDVTTVALSGGRIALLFYKAVAGLKPAMKHVHFFWADERCVTPDHPESNYRVAHELLFEPLGIADSQIHRIRGEDEPEAAAKAASNELLKVAKRDEKKVPVVDLVFLGMGEDGHVASLFPGQAGRSGVYYPVIGPKPPPQRITLSYDVLASAREVWVLVSGEGKKAALAESLSPPFATPLGRVVKSRSRTRIFTDFSV